MQTSFFSQANVPSGSSFNPKRKRQSWGDDAEYEQTKQMRRMPHSHAHDRVPSDGAASDQDMDADMDMEMDAEAHMGMGMSMSNQLQQMPHLLAHAHAPGHGLGHAQDPVHTHSMTFGHEERVLGLCPGGAQAQHNYNYSFESGSGGFGFGPGAEEDDDDADADSAFSSNGIGIETAKDMMLFSPHHPTTVRPKSPLSAQPFSTSLRGPGQLDLGGYHHLTGTSNLGHGLGSLGGFGGGGGSAAPNPGFAPQHAAPRGLLQPTIHAPLPEGASDVEKARAAHGSHCHSIPKLVLSQHADPTTGLKSMWTMCSDCGAVERSG